MKRKKIFFDCEFTWLNQNTTLISIWLVSECGKTFYAEFTDYDKTQVNNWIKNNVIKNLKFLKQDTWYGFFSENTTFFKWNSQSIKTHLTTWLRNFWEVEIWSDCLSYDWVLFNTLLADYSDWYPQLPENIYYIPFDICTLFKVKWIDPDVSREEYAKEWSESWFWKEEKHNALFDARIIKMCYNKLYKFNSKFDKMMNDLSKVCKEHDDNYKSKIETVQCYKIYWETVNISLLPAFHEILSRAVDHFKYKNNPFEIHWLEFKDIEVIILFLEKADIQNSFENDLLEWAISLEINKETSYMIDWKKHIFTDLERFKTYLFLKYNKKWLN